MNCMKCGRESLSDQVFCEDCLAEMKKYPISPNVPVILPKHEPRSAPKKQLRKKVISPEEQIVILKSRIRLLTILLIAFALLSALLVYPAVQYLQQDHFRPGQNYTSITSKTSER